MTAPSNRSPRDSSRPMINHRIGLALVVILALGACATAPKRRTPSIHEILSQTVRKGPFGTLRGTVVDRATGAPLAGFSVAAGPGWPARADSAGEFTFQRADAGMQRLWVVCPSRTAYHAQRIRAGTVRILPDSVVVRRVPVDPAQCTEPARDSLDAVFEGHYSAGFEESRFVPCRGSVERAGGRPLYATNRAWVRFDSAARYTGPPLRPQADTSGYGSRFFVRWRGRLEGPGNYGHMGVSPYLLTVREIIEVRTPGRGDCARARRRAAEPRED